MNVPPGPLRLTGDLPMLSIVDQRVRGEICFPCFGTMVTVFVVRSHSTDAMSGRVCNLVVILLAQPLHISPQTIFVFGDAPKAIAVATTTTVNVACGRN